MISQGVASTSSYSVVSVVLSRYYFFPRPYPLERILYLWRHSRYFLFFPPPASSSSSFLVPLLPHRRSFINERGGSHEFQYRGRERQKSKTTLAKKTATAVRIPRARVSQIVHNKQTHDILPNGIQIFALIYKAGAGGGGASRKRARYFYVDR